MFYRWTLLLIFCALIAFGQEYNSLLQSNPRELAKAKINDFKLRLSQALEKSATFWNSFVQGRTNWAPVIVSRRFELGINHTATLWQYLHSLQVFYNDSEMWVIVHTGEKNRQRVELLKYVVSSITSNRTIELTGPSIVSSTEAAQIVYTAVAIKNTKFAELKLFRWSGTMFGEILSTRMDGNCSALAIWKIEEFIYVALSFSEARSLVIKRVMEHSEQMQSLQLLGVDCHVIKHFSHIENHYLVCGTRDSVMIYWWSGSAFLIEHVQTLYDTVIDVAIRRHSGKVVMAVVFSDEVKFLVQDPSTRSYTMAGSIDVSPVSSLKTVLLWKIGKRLYMLPIVEDDHPVSVHEIALEFANTDIQKGPRLKECLESLSRHLSERQKKLDKLQARWKNAWTSSEELKIKSLKVNGMIKSLAKSRVGSLNITGVQFPPFSAMLKMSKEMLSTSERLKSELEKCVFKSTVQFIQSRTKFKNMTVGKGEIIGLETQVKLNGVNTIRLAFALKKKGHQTFKFHTNVSHVSCRTATTVTMNKNEIDDYVLLKSDTLDVSGRLKFSNVSVKNLLIKSNVINGIKMDDFVLTSKKQDVDGTKLFNNLSAEAITTAKGVGKVEEIKEIILNRDSKSVNSSLKFTPVLMIRGNLNITTMNGFNVLDFYSKSVKKDGKQNVQGMKSFKSIAITGNVDIRGLVNKRAINNLMTVKTDQTVYGAVKFEGTTYFQTILTGYLNGIDLSEQAVGRFQDNVTIQGVKTFRRTLAVSGITMKERILLDSLDPSFKMSDNVCTNVVDACQFNKRVTVGNIAAENLILAAGGFPLLDDLRGNVWLKTTEQNISNLDAAVIRVNNLEVSKVNGIAMEDVVTVNGNIEVDELKFNDDVLFKTLNLTEGSILKFSSEPSVSVDQDVKVKIMNKINLESAVFERNISLDGLVNGFKTGFMLNEKLQTLKDQIEFERIELKELRSKNLKFQLLNKTNFTDFFERSVVVPFKNRSIANKYFKTLKGTSMMCNGTLNNVSLDRVATTNTKQRIVSPWKFAKDISFFRMDVESFFGEIRLEDVFHIDEVGSMSNKQFNGNVTATLVNMSGYINDVNITHLQLEAFNRTAKNVVEKKIKFLSNLSSKEIQVRGKIDNVNLEDLIRLTGTVKLERLNAASVIAMNKTVGGLVNGCQWSSILQNILSFTKISENMTSRISVKSLMIDGNLNLKYLNGARMPDWITLLGLLELSDSIQNVTLEHLKAENIQFLKPVNNDSIDFLINDVVKKSLSQNITSEKRFQQVGVSIVKIDQLNTNKTCGINVSDLFEASLSIISQNGTLLKTRSLQNIIAKRVFVEGNLNGLKLPDDVVFLNTTEIFEDEVVIKNTVTAISGLKFFGNLNEIEFNKFLEDRVTLNVPDVIFSSLNFEDDVTVQGKTLINGTVNSIRIDDVVKTMLQNQTVLIGKKTFTEEVVMSNLVVNNRSVNGIFLDEIFLSSRNESVRNVQFSTLNTSSLICDTINGVSVMELFNHTHDLVHHINDKLDNFTEDILSYQESIESQKDSFESQPSIFNYFELHEILDFGKVQRFLPLYENDILGEKYELQVTQMIMWVSNEKSCRKIKSLISDVSQNGTFNVTKKMNCKIFPFSLRMEKDGVIGFYVQAERGCKAKSKKRILIETMYSSGIIEKNTIVSPANATLVDVQLIEINDIFLLTAYNIKGHSGKIFIHQFNAAADDPWTLHQTFHDQNLTSLDLVSVERDTFSIFETEIVYLAVTGDKNNPGVTIYEWDFEEDEFFFKTNASTSASSHTLWVDHRNSLHLLLAKEATRIRKNSTWVDIFTEPLEVHTFQDDELILNHTVDVKGVRSLEMFIIADEAFVVASSSHMEAIYILQLRGYNGFEVIQAIPAPGITEARVFTVDKYLYLALNSMTGKSRILKADIHGGRLDDFV